MSFRSGASVATLAEAAALWKRARNFFDERGFFEVATPVLSHDVLVDLYVEPVRVPLDGETFFLQTSPEFAMKRLLASGAKRIYQIAHAFRRQDRGRLHNVEFALLEWYRVGDGYFEGIDLLADLAAELLDRPRPAIVPLSEPFFAATGLDVHRAGINEFRAAADRLGVRYPASFLANDNAKGTGTAGSSVSRDDWIDLLFAESVQPTLGEGGGVILTDYPASQSQLAQVRTVRDRDGNALFDVAERFELFADGIELANGYHELLDAASLRRRFAQTAQERRVKHLAPLPVESRLLAAMDEGLPPSSGCALGLDRTLMVRLGLERIDDVIPFPIERA